MSDDLVLTRRDNLLNYAAHVAALEAENQGLREEIALLEEGARERSEYLVGVIEERERLRRALEEVQSAQSSNHGCMATILSDISKIATAALEPKP